MRRTLSRGGLRAQLALAIATVTAIAVGASFLALYGGTSSRLRSQIDGQLRLQRAEWQQATRRRDLSSPAAVTRAARSYIAGQRYHAESVIIAVQVVGGTVVANDSELVSREEARSRGESGAAGLLDAPVGLSTVTVADAGEMRVLTAPISSGGRRVGTLRVADPLAPVSRAQRSLRQTFLVVGLSALALAIVIGIALATAIASPLRRMARVAEAVNAGDLSRRVGTHAGSSEVRVLAGAFDHMLERLERSFRRQRDFVSDASHELRTPLSVLRAQVELLDRATDNAERRDATVTLLRRLDELDRLVGDMLTLASAEAGQLIERRPIDLGEFFEDLRRDLLLFGDREFVVTAIPGTLVADPDRLTQVLRNLIRNAVAHTEPGQRITVAAVARGDRLELSVTDTGPGIPADQLQEIFERFHRLRRDRPKDRGGTGLGLAIARALTEAHGGQIVAESPPGSGATFRLELPGYAAPARDSPSSRATSR